MGELSSYPSIFNMGHAALVDLFKEDVIIEEKVDGSQISFGRDSDGVLRIRSKNREIDPEAPEGMFAAGVAAIKSVADKLTKGWIYRGEYLQKPKHNVLAYDRIPNQHIVIFDVERERGYVTPLQKDALAKWLGFECVPLLFQGRVTDVKQLIDLLERKSFLGGQKIEGMVIKPARYDLFGRDKKVVMGKLVSPEFKEIHKREWKQPIIANILQSLTDELATPARWNKAVIHLKEEGKIVGEPRDLQYIIPAIQQDILKECSEYIKEQLFSWAWPKLKGSCVRGAAEYYKNQLTKESECFNT